VEETLLAGTTPDAKALARAVPGDRDRDMKALIQNSPTLQPVLMSEKIRAEFCLRREKEKEIYRWIQIA
jgi:hypothetical protein